MMRAQRSNPKFDFKETFDEDYLHFYGPRYTDEVNDADTRAVIKYLRLETGMDVLDIACGDGRIANRLAAAGMRVTGLDFSKVFVDKAQADAQAMGVSVDYSIADMRSISWTSLFDAAFCWGTSFGYFSDEENREVLGSISKAIKPGGWFAVELNSAIWLLKNFRDSNKAERDGDVMIDHTRYDATTKRTETIRRIVRNGRERKIEFGTRLFDAPELTAWLTEAGFGQVELRDEKDRLVGPDSRRMIAVARRG